MVKISAGSDQWFGRYGQKSGQNNIKIIGHANFLRNMKDREFDSKVKL